MYKFSSPSCREKVRVGDFVYERGRNSRLVRGISSSPSSSDSLFLLELDSLGRPRSSTVLLGGGGGGGGGGELAVHESTEYVGRKVESRRTTVPGEVATEAFEYTDDGGMMLARVTNKYFTWRLSHDRDGNVVGADFGVGNTTLGFEFGSRVATVGKEGKPVR